MTTTDKSSNLQTAAVIGAGNPSVQTQQTQQSVSSGVEQTGKQSSRSAKRACLQNYTQVGNPSSSNGAKNMQTVANVSPIPDSTLAGTLNWAVRILANRSLATVCKEKDAEGNITQFVICLQADRWLWDNGFSLQTLPIIANTAEQKAPIIPLEATK